MSRYLALAFALALPSATLAQTTTPTAGSAPAARPVTQPPRLLNVGEVSSRLGAAYPDSIRRQGIGGNVHVRMIVDTAGVPGEFAVARTSGTPQLDSIALRVAAVMRYQPATLNGRPVRVPVTAPITFQVVDDEVAPAPGASPTTPAEQAPSPGAYEMSAVERKPMLANAGSVRSALNRFYPARLRTSGVGGTALVSMIVDTDGVPTDPYVMHGSGNSELDAAAVAVARVMRFRPAMVSNQRVAVKVNLPINFVPDNPAP